MFFLLHLLMYLVVFISFTTVNTQSFAVCFMACPNLPQCDFMLLLQLFPCVLLHTKSFRLAVSSGNINCFVSFSKVFCTFFQLNVLHLQTLSVDHVVFCVVLVLHSNLLILASNYSCPTWLYYSNVTEM